jgi:integrase
LGYPADPPRVDEVIAVIRAAGDRAYGHRLRGLMAILWRSGLRIQEALALTEGDLDDRRGSLLVPAASRAGAVARAWTHGAGSNSNARR